MTELILCFMKLLIISVGQNKYCALWNSVNNCDKESALLYYKPLKYTKLGFTKQICIYYCKSLCQISLLFSITINMQNYNFCSLFSYSFYLDHISFFSNECKTDFVKYKLYTVVLSKICHRNIIAILYMNLWNYRYIM